MSSSQEVPSTFIQYSGHVPSRIDSKSVYLNKDGAIYHSVKLHGIYKDDTGWHIKEGEPEPKFVNFCNQWQGLEFYKKGGFSKKQKAHFMRVRSGLLLGTVRGERIDFLTLTTQYDKEFPERRLNKIDDLNYAWTKIKQQIEYFWQKKRYLKFCRKNGLEPYELHGRKKSVKYPEYWAMFSSKLRYIKVKTSEGGGVLHIIFRKPNDYPPIPKEWLHRQWLRIWGSWNTSIYEVPYSDVNLISRYVVGNYLVNQPIMRLSYGHQWVYKGFTKAFKRVIESHANLRRCAKRAQTHGASTFKQAIYVWNQAIKAGAYPYTQYQRRFRLRKFPKHAYDRRIETVGGREKLVVVVRDPDKYCLRYPKNCYDTDGRQIAFPKGKIVLSRPLRRQLTVQTQIDSKCFFAEEHDSYLTV